MKTRTFFFLVLAMLLISFVAKFPQRLGSSPPIHGFGPIHGDGEGYYAYLPATFLKHDLVDIDPAEYESGRDFLTHPAFTRWPQTGRYLNKYPPGVALLVGPFFALAALVSVSVGQPLDGYNLIFQFLSGTAALVFTAGGLALLYHLYRSLFGPMIAALTVLGLLLTTNLWHYTVFDSLYSHAFAFFTTSWVVFLTAKWYRNPRRRLVSLLVGVSFGLSFLVRNANFWVGLFFLSYGLVTRRALPKRIKLIARHWQSLLLIGLGLVLAIFPQLAYQKIITDKWWVFSYPGEGFDWLDPAWYGVLLSPRRGLLFWTPLFWFAALGVVGSFKRQPVWFWGVALALAVQTYLVASWSQWWFGDGLGHRAFVDGYPLWGFLVAAGIQKALRWSRSGVSLFLVACILLNLMLTGWYWGGILPRDHVTWSRYLQLVVFEGPRFSWLPHLWN